MIFYQHSKILKKRKVLEESTCPTYSKLKKTTSHVLQNCPTAQDEWSQAFVKLQKISFRHYSLNEIWQLLYEKLDPLELSEVAILMKLIQHRRNGVIHDKPFMHPNLLTQKAHLKMSNFLQAQDTQSHPPHSCLSGSHTLQKQKKPPAGFVKVNWDAACNKHLMTLSLGAVMRDHEGHVLGTLCVKKTIAINPFTAEAMGLFEVVLFCKGMPFNLLTYC